MLLGGLWHGAAWTFVLWGGYHGLGLVLDHAVGRWIRLPVWLKRVFMFHLVVLGWVLFRAQSLSLTWQFLSRLGSWGTPTLWTAPVLVAIAVAIGPQLLPERETSGFEQWFGRLRPVVLAAGIAVLILFVAATVPSDGVPPFIYFRF
jgi:hypothetical protein